MSQPSTRLKTKAYLFMLKNNKCDMCGKTASDMHELIPRSHTYTKESRDASFYPEVVSILCRTCHGKAQHNQRITTLLLLKNMIYYGIIPVCKSLNEIGDSQKTSIGHEITELNIAFLNNFHTSNKKEKLQLIQEELLQ